MGIFDDLFGGNSETTTTQVPWNAGSLNHGYLQARALLDQGPLPLYPESAVVGYSPATRRALDGLQRLAGRGSPTLAAAERQTGNTLDGRYLPSSERIQSALNGRGAGTGLSAALANVAEIARGDYLGRNPARDAVSERVSDAVSDRVNAQFGTSGRTGGAYHRQSLARGLGDALADLNATLYAQDRADQLAANALLQRGFDAERDRQERAVGNSPVLNAARYYDTDRLLDAGGREDALRQRQRDADIDRFNDEQLAPHHALERYMSIIGGHVPGTSTQSRSDNSFLQTLLTTGLRALL